MMIEHLTMLYDADGEVRRLQFDKFKPLNYLTVPKQYFCYGSIWLVLYHKSAMPPKISPGP